MNWEALSAIGEIVGAFAVVLTLGYLAVQIRGAQRTAKANVRQGAAEILISTLSLQVNNEVLARAKAKRDASEDLSNEEASQLRLYGTIWWRTYENLYYQSKIGLLEEGEWAPFRMMIGNVAIQDAPMFTGLQEVWDRQSGGYSQDFVATVNKIQSEARGGA